jgi:hypothetical protein
MDRRVKPGTARSAKVRRDEVIEQMTLLLRCKSPEMMWWTAPAPGNEVP